jgi:hypothetical protein
VFVERLWKSVKYKEVYLKAYDSASVAKANLGVYLNFFNTRRPHQSLDGKTPDTIYYAGLPQERIAALCPATHRAACLPLDKPAGGGPVDNPTLQGSTYRRGNSVQRNGAGSLS